MPATRVPTRVPRRAFWRFPKPLKASSKAAWGLVLLGLRVCGSWPSKVLKGLSRVIVGGDPNA